MEKALRTGRITIDLLGYKQAWLDHCKAHGTTPSEAFRMVVARLTAEGEARFQTTPSPAISDGKVRKEVRLTRSECREAESLAAAEGFSLVRWIAALVRARLGRGAQLGHFELEQLSRSNMRILALRKTLNQLVRVANANPESLHSFQEKQMIQTSNLVKEHAAAVAAVIQSNVERWRR